MRRSGHLRTHLMVAFALVSLVSILLLAIAAQQAVDRGIQVASGNLDTAASQAAALAAKAYEAADGWDDADLSSVEASADSHGAVVQVTDATGAVIVSSGNGRGHPTASAVVVDGVTVGAVTVRNIRPDETSAQRGRQIAWTWIALASAVSLGIALLAGWWVTRKLTRPLARLASVAHDFAAGNAEARAQESGADEIAMLAHGFNEAADAVERASRARRQMAADVAHELRTPLAALQAGLEELADGLAEPEPQTLARLHAQSVRLSRVVADLSLLAQTDPVAPPLRTRRLDLAQVAADEAQAREPELRSAGIRLHSDLQPALVVADSDRLHQVVGNLLANCARHCTSGNQVELRVSRDGHDAVLEVIDDGPGIPAEVLPKVFDRYVRGQSHVPGSGLGLAVVRDIVEGHRGTVEVTSHLGTQVVVRIPAL
jgi:two-component system, OmpR family, sensor histidine kinase BaeS